MEKKEYKRIDETPGGILIISKDNEDKQPGDYVELIFQKRDEKVPVIGLKIIGYRGPEGNFKLLEQLLTCEREHFVEKISEYMSGLFLVCSAYYLKMVNGVEIYFSRKDLVHFKTVTDLCNGGDIYLLEEQKESLPDWPILVQLQNKYGYYIGYVDNSGKKCINNVNNLLSFEINADEAELNWEVKIAGIIGCYREILNYAMNEKINNFIAKLRLLGKLGDAVDV
ncbi:MAG: hypothetical protein MJ133_06935 [Lachnospiraceae bacterium]|nr:hypothetical protein [Lachnospiraceae bacterium]